MVNKELFSYYFLEEGEEQAPAPDPNAAPPDQQADPNAQPQGDPNQMQGTPVQQPQQPNAALPDDEEDDVDSEFEKMFPMEKDGTDPEAEKSNFITYQKLQYFSKFQDLLELTNDIENTFEQAKKTIGFNQSDDEKQHKLINMLIKSLAECRDQIDFFLLKGIANVNLDKTRVIFRTIIRKLNYIIDNYDGVMMRFKRQKEEEERKKGIRR